MDLLKVLRKNDWLSKPNQSKIQTLGEIVSPYYTSIIWFCIKRNRTVSMEDISSLLMNDKWQLNLITYKNIDVLVPKRLIYFQPWWFLVPPPSTTTAQLSLTFFESKPKLFLLWIDFSNVTFKEIEQFTQGCRGSRKYLFKST